LCLALVDRTPLNEGDDGSGEKLVAIKLKELTSPRTATSVQGWVLVSNAWLAVMASAVIAPVLPRMAAHFQNTPHAPLMISLVATLPTLFIALLAAPFGLLADRVGRRILLFIGLAVYGVLGIAPYWLNSLQWIVASRAGVGVTEAMVTTCSTALIGDYFYGDMRERWFALQTGSATVVAVAMAVIGGVLGQCGWQMPFGSYSFSFLLFPLVLFFIWDSSGAGVATAGRSELVKNVKPKEESFRWSGLLGICLITFYHQAGSKLHSVECRFLHYDLYAPVWNHRRWRCTQRDGIRIGVANAGNMSTLEASASRSRSRYRRMAIILRPGAGCKSAGGPRLGTLIGWAH
jgi:MFS family permease